MRYAIQLSHLNLSVQTSVHLFTAKATWMKIKDRKVQKNKKEYN